VTVNLPVYLLRLIGDVVRINVMELNYKVGDELF
jgi:hypothetical protein